MSNGKAKGSEFEREVCKMLSVWINGTPKPYVFWRSPSSGALATIAESMDASGDIISLRPEGKFLTDRFSIELKTGYPDADFMKHFKGSKNNIIEDFWKQCVRDATKTNKYGMLIFRKKGFPALIGIDTFVDSILGGLDKGLTLTFGNTLPGVTFYDMKTFFEVILPGMIQVIPLPGERNVRRK